MIQMYIWGQLKVTITFKCHTLKSPNCTCKTNGKGNGGESSDITCGIKIKKEKKKSGTLANKD